METRWAPQVAAASFRGFKPFHKLPANVFVPERRREKKPQVLERKKKSEADVRRAESGGGGGVLQTGRAPSQTSTGVMEKLHGRAVRQPSTLLSLTVMRKWLVVKSELQPNICGHSPRPPLLSRPGGPRPGSSPARWRLNSYEPYVAQPTAVNVGQSWLGPR